MRVPSGEAAVPSSASYSTRTSGSPPGAAARRVSGVSSPDPSRMKAMRPSARYWGASAFSNEPGGFAAGDRHLPDVPGGVQAFGVRAIE